QTARRRGDRTPRRGTGHITGNNELGTREFPPCAVKSRRPGRFDPALREPSVAIMRAPLDPAIAGIDRQDSHFLLRPQADVAAVEAFEVASGLEQERAVFGYSAHGSPLAAPVGQEQRHSPTLV